MTGHIQFDERNGRRVNYTMYVMRLIPAGQMYCEALYKPEIGVEMQPKPVTAAPEFADDDYFNRVLEIVTINVSYRRLYHIAPS